MAILASVNVKYRCHVLDELGTMPGEMSNGEEERCRSRHSQAVALDVGEWLDDHTDHIIHGKTVPGNHWIGGWVDLIVCGHTILL